MRAHAIHCCQSAFAGRLALRIAFDCPDLQIVHLNDIAAVESTAYLIKYDSVHGTWRCTVDVKDGAVVITDGARTVTVPYSNKKNPADVRRGAVLAVSCMIALSRQLELKRALAAKPPVSQLVAACPWPTARPKAESCRQKLRGLVKRAVHASHGPHGTSGCRNPQLQQPIRLLQIDYKAVPGGVPDMVLECTGAHLTRASLQPYFDAGLKKVVVSAPVKDTPAVLNVVMGCNDVRNRRLLSMPSNPACFPWHRACRLQLTGPFVM